MLAWGSVMLATYKGNYRFFSFQKCNLSISCIVLIYDCAVCDGNYYSRDAVLGSSVWFFSMI